MSKKNLLQMSVIATIATILVLPLNIFVIGQENSPPTLEPIADQTVPELSPVSIVVSASDPDIPANTLTFSASGLPSWASINSSTGEITGTPLESDGPSGPLSVTVTVDDGAGGTASQTFVLTVTEVNSAPSITDIPDTAVPEGTPVSIPVSVSDPDIPSNTLTITVDSLPTWASFDSLTNTITANPLETDAPSETFNVTVTVSDGLLSSSDTLLLSAIETNTAPTLTNPGDQTVTLGNTLSLTLSATDPDIPPNTLVFSSSDLPSGATLDPSTGAFSWMPVSSQIGSNSVTFVVTDDGTPNLSDSKAITITVIDTVPIVSVPTNITAEATSPSGAVIEYTATALDAEDGSLAPTCSPPSGSTFPLGSTVVTCTATDSALNTSSASFTITVVDTTAPTVIAPLPITVEADTPTGTPISDPAIAAFLSGAIALDVVDQNLTITNDAPSIFPLGTTTITFTATDDSGNSASDTSTVTVVDTSLPSINITEPANGAKLNTTNVTVAGTVSDNTVTSVEVLVDGLSQGNATLNGTSWTKSLIMTEGAHSIAANATDASGNTALASVSVIIDTTPPVINITSPANAATLNSTSINVTGTASDANGISSVVVSIDSGIANAANFNATSGNWSFQATLANGAHTIKATANDMAGNTNMTSISIVVDTDAPTIAITSPVNGAKISSANVTISGTTNGGLSSIASVKVSIDGGTASPASFNSTTGTWTFGPVTLADGNHTAKATATDIANNTAMASVSFIVDTIPPNVAITSPSNGSTLNSTSVNISGTASDANGVTSVQVKIDTGTFALANGTTSWSFATILTTGNHTITAKATDMAGNTNSTSISVRIQIQPTPVPSELGIFSCEGNSIRGNLIIENLDVTFINCEVRGNIRISNSNIFAEDSNIRGNFVLTDSDVEIKESEIRGNFRINGGSLILTENMIRGQVKVCGTDVIEISDNTFKGGIKFCSEGEGWEDDYEEGKYSKVQGGSNQGSNDNGKGKEKSDQTSGSSGKGGKDEGKSDNDKGKPDDKEKVKGNDGSKSNNNGNGKGNSGEKGNSGKGSDNGNKGNSGKGSDNGNSGKSNGGNGGGNGKGKGKN